MGFLANGDDVYRLDRSQLSNRSPHCLGFSRVFRVPFAGFATASPKLELAPEGTPSVSGRSCGFVWLTSHFTLFRETSLSRALGALRLEAVSEASPNSEHSAEIVEADYDT